RPSGNHQLQLAQLSPLALQQLGDPLLRPRAAAQGRESVHLIQPGLELPVRAIRNLSIPSRPALRAAQLPEPASQAGEVAAQPAASAGTAGLRRTAIVLTQRAGTRGVGVAVGAALTAGLVGRSHESSGGRAVLAAAAVLERVQGPISAPKLEVRAARGQR